MTLLSQLAQPRTLASAWNRLQSKGQTAGVDGVRLDAFGSERGVGAELSALAEEVREGTYSAAPLRGIRIRKASGSSREIAIPVVRDRIVQTAALMLVTPRVECRLHPNSYAYRPGRSHADAVAAVRGHLEAGHRWVGEGDIEDFFGSVPHGPCLDRLDAVLGEASLRELFAAWLSAPVVGGSVTPGRGLPQGLAVSPVLANLYLDPFDRAAEARGYAAIRFADDFVIPAATRVGAMGALRFAERALARLGLRLHPDKSAVRRASDGVVFLGEPLVVEPPERSGGAGSGPSRGPWAGARPPVPVFSVRSSTRVEPASEPVEAASRPTPAAGAAAGQEGLEESDSGEGGDPFSGLAAYAEASSSAPPRAASSAPGARSVPGAGPGRGRRGAEARTLYLCEHGTTLRVRTGQYVIARGPEEVQVVPSVGVDRVVATASVGLSAGALRRCLRDETPVHWLTASGRYLGSLVAEATPAEGRLRAQVRAADRPDRALALARRFVVGKLLNSRALLTRAAERDAGRFAEAREALGAAARAARVAPSLETLRGIEGAAAARHFEAFARVVAPSGLRFDGRSRRPPGDPVNALLSFGYGLLHARLHGLARLRGLHPAVGFLHAPRDGHAALVSDLQEEWRPLVDALVASLVNRRVIQADGFEPGDRGGVWLTSASRRRVVRQFEAWLARPYALRGGAAQPYLRWLDRQVRRLAHALEEDEAYVPFRWR